MPPATDQGRDGDRWRRVGWFVGLWAASASVAAVALYGLRGLIAFAGG